MIYLNKITKKLLLLQRNELLSKKQHWLRKRFGRFIFTNLFINFFQIKNIDKKTDNLFRKEFDTFKNFLPKNLENIMDIGCGLGIINIFLNNYYKKDISFYLLDKNKIDSKIKYGFSRNYESYNNLNETKNLLLKNEIKMSQLNIIDVDRKIEINKKINLVISLKSMGYHYPIDVYINLLKNCCDSNTIFIFDVSEGYFYNNSFKKYFKFINTIYEESSIHSLKRLFCTGLKI